MKWFFGIAAAIVAIKLLGPIVAGVVWWVF